MESAPPGPPTFVILNPQIWRGGDLRLVGPDLASTSGLTVLFDDSVVADTALLRFAGTDTIVATIDLPGGQHSVSLAVRGERSAARPFDVGGFQDPNLWQTTTPLVSRPLPLAPGSPQWWVGTSGGLALFDVRNPAQSPVLVDSTVDPSCLYAIGASANGAVVTADRGCGTLRARTYAPGSTPIEVDSGPADTLSSHFRRWRRALNHPPGVWLLEDADSVALAVRGPAGAWQWSAWPTYGVRDLQLSPNGAIGIAQAWVGSQQRPAILVFDLAQGRLLYQDTTVGPNAAFSPSGDTIVATVEGQDTIVLLDAPTGAHLASIGVTSDESIAPWRGWNDVVDPLFWDPFGPWLIGFLSNNACGGYVVIDRRTWRLAGAEPGGDCVMDGMVAVSRADPLGWLLMTLSFSDTTAEWVRTLYIPGP